MEFVRQDCFKWKWEWKALHRYADRSIHAPVASCQATFQRRYLVCLCLCRNLIQTLRSLHCDLVYFCFLKSHQFHGDFLACLALEGRWAGSQRVRPLVLWRACAWGVSHTKARRVTATGTKRHHCATPGSWQSCSCNHMGARGCGKAGLTAPGPPGGTQNEGQSVIQTQPWPSWAMWTHNIITVIILCYIIIYHIIVHQCYHMLI